MRKRVLNEAWQNQKQMLGGGGGGGGGKGGGGGGGGGVGGDGGGRDGGGGGRNVGLLELKRRLHHAWSETVVGAGEGGEGDSESVANSPEQPAPEKHVTFRAEVAGNSAKTKEGVTLNVILPPLRYFVFPG